MDERGNPIAQVQDPAQPQPLIDVNQIRMAFGNPIADIPLFYRDSTMDDVSAKFLLDRIRIAQTTYGWTDETTAGNFKRALRGKGINWPNHIPDTLGVYIST